MEGEKYNVLSELDEKTSGIFSDFMTRITKFEELVAVGSRLLVGFQQGLELLRRPPIHQTSDVVDRILKAYETKRVKSYVEAGCISVHDGVQSISKLHTCQLVLGDHLSKAKCLLNELECLMEDLAGVMQTANESMYLVWSKHSDDGLEHQATSHEKEEMGSHHLQKPEITDYAAVVAIIYSMVKQDYIMQEKIVSSLNLNSSSGELESYCLMWSLRPFIDDEIMHRAWRFIP